MLGIREEQSFSSGWMEIVEKHLKVCGVFSRNGEVAARESGIE